MREENSIAAYQFMGARQRYDFEVMISADPKLMSALEVKGGEGNSINISERPLWASEFIVWCHLDGAIVNEPSHGAAAIIFNRVSNEMVKRGKHVDVIIFKDARCNTALRPCPKYQDKLPSPELGVAPDIFLLPKDIPSEENPHPPAHDLHTTYLPAKILAAHGVDPNDFSDHLWQVTIELVKDNSGRRIRETKIFHKENVIEVRRSAR